VIIGCGRLGSTLAMSISDRGGNVLVIDRDEDSLRKLSLSSLLGDIALTGNGTDMEVLNWGKSRKPQLVIVTGNDDTNIMIAQMVNKTLKIERVIAGLYYPECEYIVPLTALLLRAAAKAAVLF